MKCLLVSGYTDDQEESKTSWRVSRLYSVAKQKLEGFCEKVNKINKSIQSRTAQTRDYTQTSAIRPGNSGHSSQIM